MVKPLTKKLPRLWGSFALAEWTGYRNYVNQVFGLCLAGGIVVICLTRLQGCAGGCPPCLGRGYRSCPAAKWHGPAALTGAVLALALMRFSERKQER